MLYGVLYGFVREFPNLAPLTIHLYHVEKFNFLQRYLMQITYRNLSIVIVLLTAAAASAQPPASPPGGGRRAPVDPAQLVTTAVTRLMKFDANSDGRLTKQELSDSRLESLFLQADSNRDGILSKEEITAWATKEAETVVSNFRRGPGGLGATPPGGPGTEKRAN